MTTREQSLVRIYDTKKKTISSLDVERTYPKLFLGAPGDAISDIYAAGTYYEASQIDRIRPLIHEGDTVLDVGAHYGTWTIPLAEMVGQKGKVISFEPQRLVYYQLCANVFLNQVTERVEAHRFALGNPLNEGETISFLAVDAKNTGNAILSDMPALQTSQANLGESVKIYSLDSLHLTDRITFIKLDVEGYERNVLLGALETLRRNDYPPIKFECWDNYAWYRQEKTALFDLLHSLGYETECIYTNDYLATKR